MDWGGTPVRDIVKMVYVLTLITALSGFALGYLEKVTKEPIEYQQLKYVKGPAVMEVLQGSENDPIMERKKIEVEKGEKKLFFPGKKGGKIFAVAFEITRQGYHGLISLMIGIDLKTGKLTGMRVMTHSETPGLGARIVEKDFYSQFTGKGLADMALKKDGGKIAAVSGASISSKAVVDAVAEGLKWFNAHKNNIIKGLMG